MAKTEAPLTQASMRVPARAALSLADLLQGLDAPQALSATAFEIPGTADFHLQALYAQAPVAADLQKLIAPLISALDMPMPDIILAPLEHRDWVGESLDRLMPVRAGRFFIAGKHAIGAAPRAALSLMIEAGQAFGTGHHETTLGCLLALNDVSQRRRFRRALDLGCGSGVLAMAAAKLWRRKVIASDIDPVAARITRENAARNGLGALVRAVSAPGFTAPLIRANAPYDLILANILARPLIRLAHPLSRHLSPGGYVILSGLLATQEAAVRSAYGTKGLFLAKRFLRGEWSTLVLRKPDLS